MQVGPMAYVDKAGALRKHIIILNLCISSHLLLILMCYIEESVVIIFDQNLFLLLDYEEQSQGIPCPHIPQNFIVLGFMVPPVYL